ncbi:acyltransferase family protein [Planosporangium sp. 12N6]|uniref:acyltransferase family protein n=1 Tax=Planosporangium spinosum TaxID=3402278 RepID=UPI003CEA79BA
MTNKEHRGYRPALDGLRTLAVGSVIVYHLGGRWLPGGFLGVDLFFVLSGYLITGLLLDEHSQRARIRLSTFYLRRTRRLLPALLLVLVAVAVAVHYWEPPWQWTARRGDLLAGLFYYANWHLIATDQSYFAQFASQSPLRHAWSLAIEEQFYLVWPLLVVLALRWLAGSTLRRRAAVAVLVLGTVASALTMVLVYDPASPTRAYVGTDARAQQLLIGALLAVLMRHVKPAAKAAAWSAVPVVAATAALMLTVGDRGSFYYRGGATVAAVAFAALIWAVDTAPTGWVARLLSFWPLRSTGKISYGLYLWHWPVILYLPGQLLAGLPATPVRILMSFALAIASYHLVELPIRRGWPPFAVGTFPRAAVAAPTVLALCGAFAVVSTARPPAPQPEIKNLVAASALVPVPSAAGLLSPDPCLESQAICERVRPVPGYPVFAVIGDSTARALDPGMIDLALRTGWGYVLMGHNGCGLTSLVNTGGDGKPKPWMQDCAQQTPLRIRETLDRYHPRVVITSSRWETIQHLGPDGTIIRALTGQWATDIHDSLSEMARTVVASGAKLAFLPVLPVSPADTGCINHPTKPSCSPGSDALTDSTNQVYRHVADEVPNTRLISMQDVVCPANRCRPTIDGVVLRFDGVHFGPEGARWFTTRLEPRLRAAALLD